MQKKFIISMLVAGTCFNVSQAQSSKINLTGGPVVETNLSGFIHSGIEDSKNKMKVGFTTGGFLNLGISKSFSVQGEMLFNYKSSDYSWNNHTGQFSYWGMEIPIYAMYHYYLSKGNRLHIGIGPYTEFGLGASFKSNGTKTNLYEKDETTGMPALSDSNTGFGIKLGYELASGLQMNVAYKISVTNLLDQNSSTIKMYPQALSLGLAYRFGK